MSESILQTSEGGPPCEEGAEQQTIYTQAKPDGGMVEGWYSEGGREQAPLQDSHREEIRAALMAGQKTITLSADDASLEAKIAEIVRQSRLVEQGDGAQQQYIEIVNENQAQASSEAGGEDGQPNGDRVVEIDLMNFRLIRYDEDGTAQMVTTEEGNAGMGGEVGDEQRQQEHHYVQIANGIDGSHHESLPSLDQEDTMHQHHGMQHQPNVQYVQVVERDQVPLVYFTAAQPVPPKPHIQTGPIRPGRRKRGEFVLPPGVLESPNFKLFLYNCKLCDFKCNAIKELTAHKSTHPGMGSGRYRNLAKPPAEKVEIELEPTQFVEHCDQCNFKASTRLQMNRHITKHHTTQKTKSSDGQSKWYHTYEAHTNDGFITYYCCKTCSFKTDSKHLLKRHNCKAAAEKQEYAIS